MANLGYPKEVQEQILKLYAEKSSTGEVARQLGVSQVGVWQFLKRQGIPIRSLSEAMKKCTLREDAFAELTEESAYWIGFLMADGCISKGGTKGTQPSLRLDLAGKDEAHVVAFREFLGSSHSLNRRSFGNDYTAVNLQVRSQALVDGLALYGVTGLKPQRVPCADLIGNRHFWRGMVDADGSLLFRRNRNSIECVLYLSGSKGVLERYQQFLITILGRTVPVSRSKRGHFRVTVSARSARLVAASLYDGEYIALSRKRDLARSFLR